MPMAPAIGGAVEIHHRNKQHDAHAGTRADDTPGAWQEHVFLHPERTVRNESSGIDPSALGLLQQLVFAQLVVDAARCEAEQACSLRLVVMRLPHRGGDDFALALRKAAV